MKVHLYVAIGQYFDMKTWKEEGDVIGVYPTMEAAQEAAAPLYYNGTYERVAADGHYVDVKPWTLLKAIFRSLIGRGEVTI